jgi:hypothetical protein
LKRKNRRNAYSTLAQPSAILDGTRPGESNHLYLLDATEMFGISTKDPKRVRRLLLESNPYHILYLGDEVENEDSEIDSSDLPSWRETTKWYDNVSESLKTPMSYALGDHPEATVKFVWDTYGEGFMNMGPKVWHEEYVRRFKPEAEPETGKAVPSKISKKAKKPKKVRKSDSREEIMELLNKEIFIKISNPKFRKYNNMGGDPAAGTQGRLRRNYSGFGKKREEAKRYIKKIISRCKRGSADYLNYLSSAKAILKGQMILTESKWVRKNIYGYSFYLDNGIYQISRHLPNRNFKEILKSLLYCKSSLVVQDLKHLAELPVRWLTNRTIVRTRSGKLSFRINGVEPPIPSGPSFEEVGVFEANTGKPGDTSPTD